MEKFPRTYVIGDPPEDPERPRNIEPEKFEDRIIFMSMFNDVEWRQRGNSEKCNSHVKQVKNYAKRFSRGHWTLLGPGDEKKIVWNSQLNT